VREGVTRRRRRRRRLEVAVEWGQEVAVGQAQRRR
jgi:hypothetical protein